MDTKFFNQGLILEYGEYDYNNSMRSFFYKFYHLYYFYICYNELFFLLPIMFCNFLLDTEIVPHWVLKFLYSHKYYILELYSGTWLSIRVAWSCWASVFSFVE